MGRLLIVGALACVGVLAEDKKPEPPLAKDSRTQALENALKGADLVRTAQLGRKTATLSGSASWNCLAPMPGAKPPDIDPEMVRPVPNRSFGMPALAPPPVCGQEPKK